MTLRNLYIQCLCKTGRAVDIWSNGGYPGEALSNLCSNAFVYDGVHCNSMEGFLQSLKYDERAKQLQICQMKGRNAKKASKESWKPDQGVFWNDKVIDRHSEAFQALVMGAYKAMFEQNERFHDALMMTRGKRLYHTRGKRNPFETILTEQELCGILTAIRDGADHAKFGDGVLNQCSRRNCPFRKWC